MAAPIQRFLPLGDIPGLCHAFLLRQPGVAVAVGRERALAELEPYHREGICALGADPGRLALGEQVHGGEVAEVVTPTGFTMPIAGADGLLTTRPGILLGVYVADCCAVYLADKRARAVALVHSGKKGSEAGIAVTAIEKMAEAGVPPQDIVVQLSPCIRPPAYEVDFPAAIRHDCRSAGVPEAQVFDDGECTASDLEKFYSYRVENGKTGRMLALLGILPSAGEG